MGKLYKKGGLLYNIKTSEEEKMDYKIKKKRIMGKGEYGLISDNLTPVSEFKYLSITKDGLYYFMQHVDGKLDVFVGSQIIETDYTSLEFVPFGSKTLCVGRNEKRIDIVEFRKDSNEVSCVVLNESIFGSTKIDDIKICSEFVELYQNTNDGVLKGFLYHPLFGNMKPKYCDIEGYRYEAGRPFYPNGFCRSPENSEWSQECVYAIVTALVDGKKKKGIITRVRKYSWIDSFKYVWEEVEPCVHDDIIREDDLKFKLVDYIAGKRKVSLLKACT